MNFLELINKCLTELNYKQVSSFSELIKNDHKKIKTILNYINSEVCHTEGWHFLLRRTTLYLPEQTSEIENSIEGRILYLFVNGEKYDYSEDIQPFLTDNVRTKTYSVFNDKLLFPKFESSKEIDVVYYTKNSVLDADGHEKENFEKETDVSLIPNPFAQQILVYGACLRLKGNPQHIRFSFWTSMYKEALLNLKSKTSVYANDAPKILMSRD